MTPHLATRLNEILEGALSIDPTGRAAFLEHACGGDSTRREVDRLLRVHAVMGTWSLTPAATGKSQPFEPGQWLGRYELGGLLGCGGMGIVYRAHDPVIGRSVAIKVVAGGRGRTRDRNSRFLSELRILGSIAHDNVVRVYDFGEAEDFRYIVMELLDGEDLARAIACGGRGDLARKLEIARQIATALEHIHAAGIVHCDLKPGNVFLESSGRVKLMDFGIAQSSHSLWTGSGEVIGTPQYMAPEQLKGFPGSPLMDVYAFGVVLFELLAGQSPFAGIPANELLARMASHVIPIGMLEGAGVPDHLIELTRGATNRNPGDRPQSFSDILELLEGPARVANGTRSLRVKGSTRRFRSIAAGCAIALLSAMEGRRHPNTIPADGSVAAEVADAILPSGVIVEASAAVVPALRPARVEVPVHKTGITTERPRSIEPDVVRVKPAEGVAFFSREPDELHDSSTTPAAGEPLRAEPRAAEEIEWERLRRFADLEALEVFQRTYPNGRFAADARAAAATLEWSGIQHSDDPQIMRAFAAKYPESAHGGAAARLALELAARQAARREILALLERYAAAYRAKNTREIAALWPGLTGTRLRMIEASFAHAEKLEFTLAPYRDPELGEPAARSAFASASYRGDAVVACRRHVQMTDRSGVRPDPSEGHVVVRLARADNRWTIVSID